MPDEPTQIVDPRIFDLLRHDAQILLGETTADVDELERQTREHPAVKVLD